MTKTRDLADLGGGFIQAGTGAVQRTVESKLQDVVSVKDFGAVGDGARLNEALAANGGMVYLPQDSYNLEVNVTPTSGGLFIDPGSTFDYYDRLKARGSNSNLGNGVNVWRFQDRAFVGGAVSISPTTTPHLNGFDIAGDPNGINSDYLERSAAFASSSAYGGTGGLFSAKQSRQYTASGYSVWAGGQAVTVGTKRGYNGNLYSATTSGTTGATPPTHLGGAVSDGGVTWQFDRFAWMVPIGLSAVADADVADGHSCWALYLEGLRRSTGGTLLTTEIAVKNKGSEVINNPYNILAAGSTIGFWFAGGGDASLGAPANPSTAAIAIGKNSAAWNRGIIFSSDSLTSENVAIGLAKDHGLVWFTTDESKKAKISCARTASGVGTSYIDFQDSGIWFSSSGQLTATLEGGASDNSWLRIQGGFNQASISAGSSSADAELNLYAKGTGSINLASILKFSYEGFTLATTPANFTADRYMRVTDGAGTSFYIPARLATW